MSDDAATRVHFYDPHPGLLGARAPIPAAVKSVADAADGTDGPLETFVAAVRAACPEGFVKVHDDFVSLRVGPVMGPGHSWRVIRIRSLAAHGHPAEVTK
jgi:hypothetical protein